MGFKFFHVCFTAGAFHKCKVCQFKISVFERFNTGKTNAAAAASAKTDAAAEKEKLAARAARFGSARAEAPKVAESGRPS